MRILLINDPEGDKSAASLDVKVGCSLDPKPLYGTAHFLEHMLFQGTDKYPSENEYSAFMTNNESSAYVAKLSIDGIWESVFVIGGNTSISQIDLLIIDSDNN